MTSCLDYCGVTTACHNISPFVTHSLTLSLSLSLCSHLCHLHPRCFAMSGLTAVGELTLSLPLSPSLSLSISLSPSPSLSLSLSLSLSTIYAFIVSRIHSNFWACKTGTHHLQHVDSWSVYHTTTQRHIQIKCLFSKIYYRVIAM